MLTRILSDIFKLWCWRRFLRVPCTAKRSNQSIPKVINPEHPLERLILKLKLQYFGHLTPRADSLEKILMLRNIEGKRRGMAEDEMLASLTTYMYLSKLWEIVEDRGAWHAAVHGVAKSWTRLRDWTTTTILGRILGPFVFQTTLFWSHSGCWAPLCVLLYTM